MTVTKGVYSQDDIKRILQLAGRIVQRASQIGGDRFVSGYGKMKLFSLRFGQQFHALLVGCQNWLLGKVSANRKLDASTFAFQQRKECDNVHPAATSVLQQSQRFPRRRFKKISYRR